MTPEQRAVQTRWDAFLIKIRQRTEEILGESYSGCMAVFVEAKHDPFTMSNVLPAVRGRLHELNRKVEAAWCEKVMDAFFASGLIWETGMTVEHDKISALRAWVDKSFDGFETRIQADASRILASLMEKKIPTQLNCTQCGAPIPLAKSFTAVNVQCRACRSVNTFEPNELRLLHSFAIPALAREAAWEELNHEKPLPKPAYLVGTSTYAQELSRWRERLQSR